MGGTRPPPRPPPIYARGYSSFAHLCHPELITATRFCMEYQNMPSRSCNLCNTYLAARVVTRSSKYSSITPTLKKLHRLPVKYRIIFKVVLLTFKALHGVAPNYLKTLLQSYMPSRSLRSETRNLLIMPKACRKLGCHSFAYAAPKLWSELLVNIRTTTSIVSFRSSFFFTNCCFLSNL